MAKTQNPTPPNDLSAHSAAFWLKVTGEFVLEAHHLCILHQACIALDRIADCKSRIKSEGLVIPDRFGQSRENPAAALELKYLRAFKSHLRELQLDVEPADSGYDRLPRLADAGRKHA